MIERALAALDESRAIRVEQNDPRGIAVTQHALADLYVKLGRWDEALALYQASLTTSQQLNDPRGIAVTQGALAGLYVQLGRRDEARALYEASLTTFQQLNDPRGIAATQRALAGLYVQLGRWDEARALYEASLTTKQQLNDPRGIAVTQHALAGLYVQLGRWDEARALYEASLTTKQQLNDPREIAVTQINLAQLLILRGENLPRALTLLWEGYAVVEKLNNPHEIQAVRDILVDFRSRLGAGNFDRLWSSSALHAAAGLADKLHPPSPSLICSKSRSWGCCVRSGRRAARRRCASCFKRWTCQSRRSRRCCGGCLSDRASRTMPKLNPS
jgi:tetratricopeptide (TPR) repeat protein